MTAATCCSRGRSMVAGTITCWICRAPKPFSDGGAGDNTFGGFLSPDDRAFYYEERIARLWRSIFQTRVEREVYRVPDDWVGYGARVANSDCTSLVGIEIAKRDWTPLNDWKIFHDFFHKGSPLPTARGSEKTGASSTIHEEEKLAGASHLPSV